MTFARFRPSDSHSVHPRFSLRPPLASPSVHPSLFACFVLFREGEVACFVFLREAEMAEVTEMAENRWRNGGEQVEKWRKMR